MTSPDYIVGAFVLGSPASPRALARHGDLLAAYADGSLDDGREAYLSHFVFGPEMQAHFSANRGSVAGFAGPHGCRWLVLDIDAAELAAALADARKLAGLILRRYGEEPAVWFSGCKGFHVLLDLAHRPAPSATFARTAKTFAAGLAALAGVRIDPSVYDVAHIIRLPNTRHPRTGLFKRRLDLDALFALDVAGILDHATHPAGDGIGSGWTPTPQLADDWAHAERDAAAQVQARATIRRDHADPGARAPRYLVDFLRFGVDAGERHQTLFRCAAWLAEQGAPPSLVAALLTEPGGDVGLSPKDVQRQIQCGIDHARRQRGADPDADERRAIAGEADPLPPDALGFFHGANFAAESEGGPA